MHTFDLEPIHSVPEFFKDSLTREEISGVLRDTAKGKYAGKPILADDLPETYRAFTTWSLFLVSNPAWLREDNFQKVAGLRQAYWGFARAIGGRHAAVWFAKKAHEASGADAAMLIDDERCAAYAEKLGLDLRKSPHVVVTAELPALDRNFTPSILLELNGLSPSSTETLLTELANQLVNKKLNEVGLKSEQWWLGWRDAATKTLEKLRKIAQWVTITVNTQGEATVKITAPKESGE